MQLQTALTNLNDIIRSNNKRTIYFEVEKNRIKERLKEHFAAEFEIELKNEQDIIEQKMALIKNKKKEILSIKKNRRYYKRSRKINVYLKKFFGKDDIRIEPTNDKKNKLVRESKVAKNLSEGEKTAISFAYFIVKLDEQNNF